MHARESISGQSWEIAYVQAIAYAREIAYVREIAYMREIACGRSQPLTVGSI